MEITGTSIIAAPQPAVWDALNDPEVLRKCLPGCESVERVGADDFRIVMTAILGPMRARFNGKLLITDAEAPTQCKLRFEGQGGAMGFGKGVSAVSLKTVPEGTELTYTAQAQVGGKLAQVGSRLIDSVARKMSEDFFDALRRELEPAPAAAPAAPVDAAPAAGPPAAIAQRPGPAAAPAPRTDAAPAATPMVPAWWLGVAVAIGAAAAIAGSLLIR